MVPTLNSLARGPSVTDPHRLPAVANAVMEVLAAAVGKLATIADGER